MRTKANREGSNALPDYGAYDLNIIDEEEMEDEMEVGESSTGTSRKRAFNHKQNHHELRDQWINFCIQIQPRLLMIGID